MAYYHSSAAPTFEAKPPRGPTQSPHSAEYTLISHFLIPGGIDMRREVPGLLFGFRSLFAARIHQLRWFRFAP